MAELHSFSRAALQLGITAPLVSRQISALEKHLGIRLFNRSTRVVELSEAGERYYPRALELIEQLQQLESDVSDLGRRPGGLLRISVPMDFGRLFLGQALREFLSLYPDIRLQVTYEDRQAQLIEEGVDAVIRIGRLTDSSLVARTLGSACIGCFASPDYLQVNGMPNALPNWKGTNYWNTPCPIHPGSGTLIIRMMWWTFTVYGDFLPITAGRWRKWPAAVWASCGCPSFWCRILLLTAVW